MVMILTLNIFAYLFWDPAREMLPFDLPLLGRPLLWYGFFFAFGFLLGYGALVYLLRQFFGESKLAPGLVKKEAGALAERIAFAMIIGSVVGARLGDLFFYQSFAEIVRDPLSIFRVWEGGLASHGAALGILLALFFTSRRLRAKKLGFLTLLDFVVIPAAIGAFFIRIGNFFNQEILGKVTSVPWAIVFGHPLDGSSAVPRHPVQLYEACGYLAIGALLFWAQRRFSLLHKKGKLCGLFLLLLFLFRFFVEFFKEEQSSLISPSSPLTMGQLLSLPFILLGISLLFRKK
jgi:phosphatidylglycerol---prolipoprotein diacylglyceryl transferase